eukprot:SAG22_NODE_862_length_6808_cov_3.881204_9_plen_202_part_00
MTHLCPGPVLRALDQHLRIGRLLVLRRRGRRRVGGLRGGSRHPSPLGLGLSFRQLPLRLQIGGALLRPRRLRRRLRRQRGTLLARCCQRGGLGGLGRRDRDEPVVDRDEPVVVAAAAHGWCVCAVSGQMTQRSSREGAGGQVCREAWRGRRRHGPTRGTAAVRRLLALGCGSDIDIAYGTCTAYSGMYVILVPGRSLRPYM